MYKKKQPKKKKTNDEFVEENAQLFVNGLKNMTITKGIIVLFLFIIAYKIVQNSEVIGAQLGFPPIFTWFAFLAPILLICGFGMTNGGTEEEQFRSIALTNANGDAPQLIRKSKSKTNSKIEERIYHSDGIPIEKWLQKRSEIEAALDCSIVFIERNGETKKEVLVGVIDSKYNIPSMIEWTDDFIPGIEKEQIQDGPAPRNKMEEWMASKQSPKTNNDDAKGFKVVLGEGITGPIKVDLDAEPHMIIGGTTGSGKSVLLRSVLWQCIRKGAKVYIVDFKGGVEFGGKWNNFSKIYSNREEAIEMLKILEREMEARFKLFKKYNCKNLIEYNEKNPDKPLTRIILACDEVGSMMNKHGADKETKADLAVISKVLMELAMKSRAAGINMVLATQRPDAETLPGQLRSNLPIRVCGQVGGKAGLSEIVLDDPIAGTISKRQRGRFYCNVDGMTEMQGFMFSDNKHMCEGNWQIGTMIIKDNTTPEKKEDFKDIEQETVDKELDHMQEAKKRAMTMGVR